MAFSKFSEQKSAKSLQNTLSRCGLKVADIGPTFQSDHLKIDGEIFGSALDHVYFSSALENKLGKFVTFITSELIEPWWLSSLMSQ